MLDLVQAEIQDRMKTLTRKRDLCLREAAEYHERAAVEEAQAALHSGLLEQYTVLVQAANTGSPGIVVNITGKVKQADLEEVRRAVTTAAQKQTPSR